MNDTPETVICRYQLKPGAEPAMLKLIAKHWPALHRAGLVTDEPPLVLRALPDRRAAAESARAPGGVLVEIFAWKGRRSAELAHHTPEVMAIWEPMGALCEAMEFPHFAPVALDLRP
jgi:hypothetical protein